VEGFSDDFLLRSRLPEAATVGGEAKRTPQHHQYGGMKNIQVIDGALNCVSTFLAPLIYKFSLIFM
jgi:hypothetical protein